MQFTAGVCTTGPSRTKRSRSSRPLTSFKPFDSHALIFDPDCFSDRSVTARAHAAISRIAIRTWSKQKTNQRESTSWKNAQKRNKLFLTLMAAPLAEARSKATTLPRRAAVDPTAGAAERESAKFICFGKGGGRKRKKEGKDEPREVNSQHYYFFEETEGKKNKPRRPLGSTLSLLLLFLPFTRRGAAAPGGLLGLSSFLLLSFSICVRILTSL